MPLRNWARTVRFEPAVLWAPRDEAELMERMARGPQKVRAIGSLHSWSDAPVTDGLAISLEHFRGVRGLEGAEVRVGAGTRLRDLVEALAYGNMALPVLGSVTEQTVGGVVATGTHGSSMGVGSFSSLVTGLRLVDGLGRLQAFDVNHVWLPGAKLSIGALGVVTELSLRCETAFSLVEELALIPFDTACADLASLARSAEFVKMWWLPHTAEVLLYRYHRGRRGRPRTELARAVDEHVLNGLLFAGLVRAGALFPRLVPAINRFIQPIAFKPALSSGPMDRMLTVAMPPRHFETEAAIPLERAGFALDSLRSIAERHPVNFMQELRFGPPEDAWLAGAYGRPTAHLGAYIAGFGPTDRRARDPFFAEVWAMLGNHAARFHWGKELPPGDLVGGYPRLADFRQLAAKLDPLGLFKHGLAARVLG